MSFTDNSYFSNGDFPEEHQDSLQDTFQELEPPSLVSPYTTNRRNMARSRSDPRNQSDAVRQQNAALAAARSDQQDQDVSSDDDSTVMMDDKTKAKLAKLRAKVKCLEADRRQNKRAKKAHNKQMLQQIRSVVKDNLWRTTKFVTSPAQQDVLIDKIWQSLDYSDATRQAIGETTWKAQFGTSCLTLLNEQRSYAVSRLREAAFKKMSDGGGPDSLPSFAQIYACALRNVQTGPVRDIYPWYTVTLIKAACGNRYDWPKSKRCFHGPSTCHYPENGAKLHIPPSTEAFICLAWECYRNVWKAQFEFKQDPNNADEPLPVPRAKNGEPVAEDMKKFQARYTQLDGGSTLMGGWSNEGMQRFHTLTTAIKAARAEPRCQPAEQEVLPRVRELDRIEANTEAEFLQNNRRVSARAPPTTQEVAFEEEV
jgi:hypothetical protein